MKIAQIICQILRVRSVQKKTASSQDVVLVRVVTENGLEGIGEADYVKMRTERDKTLSLPALILPAVQVNIRAGAFPTPEANGVSYLKVPLDRF
jgi:L-alanine-DL-glutamate epimerase-like enolase superfamily enzyme